MYLTPAFDGVLCAAVTTMPSADPLAGQRLCVRIARDTAGAGVHPPLASSMTRTRLMLSTSTAVAKAGSERGCVSRPMKSGAKRGSAMSAAAKDDPLRAIADVGRPGVVRRAKHLGIDERVRRGRLPHERIDTHVITVDT
jgi:hypothetical protein